MATLADYKITSKELTEWGIDPTNDNGIDDSAAVVNNAYESLITYIMGSNDDLAHTKAAIYAHLIDDTNGDSADKIEGFKWAQYLTIHALLTTEANPITEEVQFALSGRCGLIMKNGFQKN